MDRHTNDGWTIDGRMMDRQSNYILGFILIQQYSICQGLTLFGERGKDAFTRELNQIHEKEFFSPLDASTLMSKEINAITSVMFEFRWMGTA